MACTKWKVAQEWWTYASGFVFVLVVFASIGLAIWAASFQGDVDFLEQLAKDEAVVEVRYETDFLETTRDIKWGLNQESVKTVSIVEEAAGHRSTYYNPIEGLKMEVINDWGDVEWNSNMEHHDQVEHKGKSYWDVTNERYERINKDFGPGLVGADGTRAPNSQYLNDLAAEIQDKQAEINGVGEALGWISVASGIVGTAVEFFAKGEDAKEQDNKTKIEDEDLSRTHSSQQSLGRQEADRGDNVVEGFLTPEERAKAEKKKRMFKYVKWISIILIISGLSMFLSGKLLYVCADNAQYGENNPVFKTLWVQGVIIFGMYSVALLGVFCTCRDIDAEVIAVEQEQKKMVVEALKNREPSDHSTPGAFGIDDDVMQTHIIEGSVSTKDGGDVIMLENHEDTAIVNELLQQLKEEKAARMNQKDERTASDKRLAEIEKRLMGIRNVPEPVQPDASRSDPDFTDVLTYTPSQQPVEMSQTEDSHPSISKGYELLETQENYKRKSRRLLRPIHRLMDAFQQQ